MILALMLLAFGQAQPVPTPPAQPQTPTRSRFENIATPDEAVPLGSRVQRRADYVTSSERDAAWTMHRFAECLVRTREQQMVDLIASPLNSPEQNRIVRDVIGWRSRCLRARSMQIDNVLLRGAVAEALYRQELRGRQIGRPRQAPPLIGIDTARSVPAALQLYGRCMTRRDPQAVRALVGTRPGSREERAALQAVTARLPECLPAAPERARHPLLLRAAVAEAFYLAHHGLIPATAEGPSAGADSAATERGPGERPPTPGN
jgi:hypothetical protein